MINTDWHVFADGILHRGPPPTDRAIGLRGHPEDVNALARHMWDGTWAVPGVPEAEDQDEGIEALNHFTQELNKRSLLRRRN